MPNSPSLIGPIIGAVGVIIGAIIAAIPPFLAYIDSTKRYYKSSRESAINGVWTGKGEDFFVEKVGNKEAPLAGFELTLNLKMKRRRIAGRGELNDQRSLLTVDGGFQGEDYFQLKYRNEDPQIRQIGVIVFRLSALGDSLEGFYAGYSPTRGIFVVGSVSLKRFSKGIQDAA
jgi:hypothetical protein